MSIIFLKFLRYHLQSNLNLSLEVSKHGPLQCCEMEILTR